jgi:uncharacterized membrane protein HdeD (DUF308 family)
MSDAVAGTKAVQIPWWLVLIQGILSIIIGGWLLYSPVRATVALVFVLGWWWLFSGFFELGTLFVDRTQWGWRVFSGLLSIIAGGYIVASPLLGAAIVVGTATLFLGIAGILVGIADIAKAFQGAGWGKGLLGVFSLVLGAVIAFNFTEFAAGLPWVWGIFGLGIGIATVIASFQLRSAQK